MSVCVYVIHIYWEVGAGLQAGASAMLDEKWIYMIWAWFLLSEYSLID